MKQTILHSSNVFSSKDVQKLASIFLPKTKGETNREDCSKNPKVSKAHNYGTFEQILTIRKFTGRRHKPPYFLYISKNNKVKQCYPT